MTDKRLDYLSNEVYQTVFQLLDGEPDFNGDEAGRIASKLEGFFRELTCADHFCIECGSPTLWSGLCPDCAENCPDEDYDVDESKEWEDFDRDC